MLVHSGFQLSATQLWVSFQRLAFSYEPFAAQTVAYIAAATELRTLEPLHPVLTRMAVAYTFEHRCRTILIQGYCPLEAILKDQVGMMAQETVLNVRRKNDRQ